MKKKFTGKKVLIMVIVTVVLGSGGFCLVKQIPDILFYTAIEQQTYVKEFDKYQKDFQTIAVFAPETTKVETHRQQDKKDAF